MKVTLTSNTYHKKTFNGDDIVWSTVMQPCFTNKAYICAFHIMVFHIRTGLEISDNDRQQ